MDTQQDIAALEKIVVEKQQHFERYDRLATQKLNSDPNLYGGVGLRPETWNALEQLKVAEKELEKAKQDLEKAKQRLEIPKQQTKTEIRPVNQNIQTIQPEPQHQDEQLEDQQVEETPTSDDAAADAHHSPEETHTTGEHILNVLTKKFTGNKIVDKLLNKMGDKDE